MKLPILFLGVAILFIGCTNESIYHSNIAKAELDCKRMGLYGFSTHKHYNGFWQSHITTITHCVEKIIPNKHLKGE